MRGGRRQSRVVLASLVSLVPMVMMVTMVMMAVTSAMAVGVSSGPVYPPPPAEARLRYLGQITDNRDFQAPENWLKKLASLVVGKRKPVALVRPHGLGCGAGLLLVADPGTGLVHRFSLADSTWSVLPREGRLPAPVDAAAGPDGLVYVSDSAARQVVAFAADGRQLFACEGPFERPTGLAFDFGSQRLLVADAAAHQIIVLGADGRRLQTMGGRGEEGGRFNFPIDVCVLDDGSLLVLDAMNFRIHHLAPTGQPLDHFGDQGDAQGYFSRPRGLTVDPRGRIHVSDALQDHFQIFDPSGQLLLAVGTQGHGPGEFWMPAGIAADDQGRIFVADAYNHRVQVFEYLSTREGVRP